MVDTLIREFVKGVIFLDREAIFIGSRKSGDPNPVTSRGSKDHMAFPAAEGRQVRRHSIQSDSPRLCVQRQDAPCR